MADEESIVVELQDHFYRDRFGVVFIILACIASVILALAFLSYYLHSQKPPPINFGVYEDWRIQGDIPITESYISEADLLQHTSDILKKVFVFNFYHFDAQLSDYRQYFTESGWEAFQKQLGSVLNPDKFKAEKQFSTSAPTAAPYILNKGILSGRFAWWVQAPVKIILLGGEGAEIKLKLQLLLVRVSTLNNLSGVAIENVISADQPGTATGEEGSANA